jgi:predicted DNA-binding transcriptional regulator
MSRDKVVGLALLVVSIVIIVVYAYVMFATPYSLLLLKLTGVIGIAVIFGVLAWVGYTLATTPNQNPSKKSRKKLRRS